MSPGSSSVQGAQFNCAGTHSHLLPDPSRQQAGLWEWGRRPEQAREQPPAPRTAPPAAKAAASLHSHGHKLAAGDHTKTSSHLTTPARLFRPSFMSSEHSNYNLGCFSVLVTSPKETGDPGGTWSREVTSGKEVSEGLKPQGAGGAGAACSPPTCLCGRSGSARRAPGHGSP